GTLNVQSGGSVTGANVYIGNTTGSTGTATITGTGSQLTSTTNLIVGSSGTGALTVQNGGNVGSSNVIYVGNNTGSNGTLNVQSGGSVTGASVYIGNNSGSNGSATITGAGSQLTASTSLSVGSSGTGALTVSDSGAVSTTGTLTIATFAGSTGTLNIGAAAADPAAAAGTVSASAIQFGAGTGTINFNHTGTAYTFGTGISTTNLATPGSLVFVAGTTTLSGNSNAFAGDTTVTDGTLNVTGTLGSTTTNNNKVIVANGNGDSGTMTITGVVTSSSLYVGNNSGSAGTLSIESGGAYSGTNVYIGSNTGSNGTLNVQSGGSVTGANVYIGNTTGSTGTATITGTGSQLTSTTNLIVGLSGTGSLTVQNGGNVGSSNVIYVGNNNGSSGTLNVQSGGSVTGASVYIGNNSGSNGSATITGAGSQLTASTSLSVGSSGTGALTVSDSGAVSTTGTLTIATFAGSTGMLNIGAAAADPAAAAGTVSASAIQFGAGTGTINFNHTGTAYTFAPVISGSGTVNFLSGTTILTGNSAAFAGMTEVSGGVLVVNGALGGDLAVSVDGRVRGSGTLNELVVDNGGTAAPGNSIGTLNTVNATFNPGSTYEVEVNAAGQSDLINASGTATLNGGTVIAIPYPDYRTGAPYMILTAAGGVAGTFDDASTSSPFLTAALTYDANQVYLTLNSNSIMLVQAAQTSNQAGLASSIDALPSANSAASALLALPSLTAAQKAFDLLSGEIHASTAGALIQDQAQLQEAIPDRSLSPGAGRYFWVQTLGSLGETGRTADTAPLDSHRRGLLTGMGFESKAGRYGLALGASQTSLMQDERGSEADINSVHLLAYGGHRLQNGGIVVNGGLSASLHDIETRRSIAFGSFGGTSSADYRAQTAQIFGETSRPIPLVNSSAILIPYLQAAYTLHHSGNFSENGDAGLSGGGETAHLATTTLGLRFRQEIEALDLPPAQFRIGAGWRHNYDGFDPKRTLAFNDAPDSGFTIKGAPIDRDILLANAGITLRLGERADLSFSCDTSFGQERRTWAAASTLAWRF
ncbi:autotransporter domain-containing protein, partial [Xanthobacter autotrophicus]|uniref:autotransporter outer membrane beta-barrel domain-containing protein n=3 Tax=Xanthobacter TaxID=279 RepID=UPI0024AB88A3